MGKAIEYNATLEERVDHTEALTTFKIVPDQPMDGDPKFVPGQYTTLGLNNEENEELGSVKRAMSIASAPEKDGALEFYIRFVAHPESPNPLTHLLWKLQDGQRIWMGERAKGKFTLEHTLEEDDSRTKVLVAAGTGLAPFVSMVRSEKLRDDSVDLGSYAILHGASYPEDLVYREELEALAASNGMRYRRSISRPKEAPEWNGDVGRVEDYFLADRLGDLESELGLPPGGLTPDAAVVFICGLTGTIGKTIERLLGRGFVPQDRKIRRALEVPDELPSNVFYEQYDSTPVIDVNDPAVIDPLREALHKALAAD